MNSTLPHAVQPEPEAGRSDWNSLRRLWALAGPRRGAVLLGAVFRFAQSICLGLAFVAVVFTVTGLSEGRRIDGQWVEQICGLLAVSLFGQTLFSYLSTSQSWLSSYKVGSDLRLSILDHLRRLPMGFHLNRHKGDTVAVLTSDMQMLESFLSDALPRLAQAFGLPVVALAYLFWKDWALGCVALISILVAFPILVLTGRKLAVLGLRRQDLQAAAGARMIEYVQGMGVIRAFNSHVQGHRVFRAALDDFRNISVRMVARLTLPLVLFGTVLMLGAPLIMIAASVRHLNGQINLAGLISALLLITSLYAPLLTLISVMELARMADGALTRTDRILTASPLANPPSPVASPDGFEVRFEAACFGYRPDRPVLKDISLVVPERTMTAVIGSSGSGKTTLLNLLARFWDLDQGRITIGGVDVRALSEQQLHSLITVVFQDVYLFAGSIFDNIAFGRDGATPTEVEAAAAAAGAHDFITALPNGYQSQVHEGGTNLSGGEKQRISIARAILKDAPIVLLDEATAALDSSHERAIQSALGRLVAEKTLIVVAHRLDTIRSADQILVLEQGQVVERGDHDRLMDDGGRYAALWNDRRRTTTWQIRTSRGAVRLTERSR